MSSLFDIKDVNLFFAFLLYELWRRKIQLWVKWKLETFSKSALQFKYDLFKQSQILTSISWFLEMELERMKDFASKRVARNFSIEGSGCFHQLYSTMRLASLLFVCFLHRLWAQFVAASRLIHLPAKLIIANFSLQY